MISFFHLLVFFRSFAFLALIVLLTFSLPLSTGDIFLPHAAADLSRHQTEIQRAILHLKSLNHISEPPQEEKLCGLSVFEDLTKNQRKIIKGALRDIPCIFLQELETFEVFDDMSKPRALAGEHSLYFRSDLFSLPEAERVIIHEFGHIVDLGGLQSADFSQKSVFVDGHIPLFTDDPSVAFYQISWEGNDQWSRGTSKKDFVSGYAATDPFEDFAESFLFYQREGETFRTLAQRNDRLQKKYRFFRDQVFGGKEFGGKTLVISMNDRPWDATKMK